MKMMKKLAALALAIMLTLGMSTTALAADITVENAVEGQTYTAYKLFEVTKSGDNVSYYMTDDQYKIWGQTLEANGIKLTKRPDGNYNLPPNAFTEAQAASLAEALNNVTDKGTAAKTASGVKEGEKVQAKFTGLEPGYYFIDSSLGAVCALMDADSTFTMIEKNAEPTVTKKAGEGPDLQAAISAQVGKEIPFTVTIKAGGKADTDYVLHDTMSEGLEYVENSLKVTVNGSEIRDYTFNANPTHEDETACSLEVTFDKDYTKTLSKDTEIVVTYKAKVTEKAIHVVADTTETNTVVLEYGGSKTTVTDKTTVTIHTGAVKILKYANGNKEQRLAGAVFAVINSEGEYFTKTGDVYSWETLTEEQAKAEASGVVKATTIATEDVYIEGLEAGTYKLVELEAPEGYNKLAAPIDFELKIEGSNMISLQEVENLSGSTLPSTGGIGTTIFYVVGGILVAGAVVLLVTKKRMSDRS